MPELPFVVAVASRGRLRVFEEKTYGSLLKPHGLENLTYVFVDSDTDEADYRRAFPDVAVVRCPAEGFVEKHTFLRSFFGKGQRVLYLHDDVSRVLELDGGDEAPRRWTPCRDFPQLCVAIFEILERLRLTLAGVYPLANAGWASTAPPVTLGLRFVYHPIHLFLASPEEQPCSVGAKLDYELTIRCFLRDGGVARINFLSCDARPEPFKKKRASEASDDLVEGGLRGRTAETELAEARRLMDLFPRHVLGFRLRRGTGRSKDGRPSYTSLRLARLPFRGLSRQEAERHERETATHLAERRRAQA